MEPNLTTGPHLQCSGDQAGHRDRTGGHLGERDPRHRVRGSLDVVDHWLSPAHLGGEDEVYAVKVLLAAVRRGAGEVLVVDAEQLTDGGDQTGLLEDLARHRD